MIIFDNVKYALTNNEFVDSLFTDGGTLTALYKIKRLKKAVLYYIDEKHGFGFNCFGVPFQFSVKENGKNFYQCTLREDKKTFEAEYQKEMKKNWSLTTYFFN